MFSSLVPNSRIQVTSASGQGHNVIGVGNVAITILNGEIQLVNKVLCSLGIWKNLLSVRYLTDKQLKVEFHNDECFILNTP